MAVVRLVGLVVGLAAGLVLSRIGPTGAAAPAIAAAVLVAVLVSELGRPRPERQHGSGAALEVRRVRDYVRPAVAWGVVVGGLVLVAELALLLGAGTWVRQEPSGYTWYPPLHAPQTQAETVVIYGSEIPVGLVCGDSVSDLIVVDGLVVASALRTPDWEQRVREACQDQTSDVDWSTGEGVVGAAFGTIGTAALALLLGPLVLRATVRAPRAGADEQTRERDERWRRGSAGTVVATAGWIVFVPLALWNIALLLVAEDPGSFTGPVDYVRLAVVALLAAGGVIGAAFHAVALAQAPDR